MSALCRICGSDWCDCKAPREIEGGLFRPMARDTDPDTSHGAAVVVAKGLGKIQALVLDAYTRHGPMTARTCERLPEFEDYGFSTIRKRISELASAGLLEECGVDRSRRSPATIYTATERDT